MAYAKIPSSDSAHRFRTFCHLIHTLSCQTTVNVDNVTKQGYFCHKIPLESSSAIRDRGGSVWLASVRPRMPPTVRRSSVMDQTGSTRHLPFFAELAALEDGNPSWRAVSGGLVVLRLVDAWIEEGSAAVAADGWGIRSVEAAIEEMPSGMPARAVLRSVVAALKSSPANEMHAIAPRLMAYARSLDLDAKWALAADVYETIIAHVHPVEESDVAITAYLRRAFCERSVGELDAAVASYEAASRIALEVDDLFGVLRAQIGTAKIAMARGNMPQAETLLDDTIESARKHELKDVHAMALQDRAAVAHLRGSYDHAVRLAYTALEMTTDAKNRDRLLTDIAGSFYMLGARSAARDAYTVIEATAQEQYQRWVATINLMEIAATEGSMPLFERFRRNLIASPLPPNLEAELHLHAGIGYESLGEPKAAHGSLERARSIASRYGYNQIVFQSDDALQRLERAAPRCATPEELPVPDQLRDVAESLSELRRKVTITM
ncbi:MAG: tetratricopeptide repeat protein [Gemmatimonadales bacterium]